MSKIINITSSLSFGDVTINLNKTLSGTVENSGTEKITVTSLISNSSFFTPETITPEILMPAFPPSSTLYFGANGTICDSNGIYYTTDQGYGYFGTTDEDGRLTVGLGGMNNITITTPTDAEEISARATYLIQWTYNNVSVVDLEYSTNGTDWTEIASGLDAATQGYYWFVPDIAGNITIRATGDSTVTDTVDCTIAEAPLYGGTIETELTVTGGTLPMNQTYIFTETTITGGSL